MIPSDNTWWESALPAVRWLRGYQREWFRPDLVAGITLAAYLLPAALGDASLANLPPQAGLYACLFGGLVFWIFCSSQQTVVSVTSAISIVIGSSLGEITGGNTLRFGALAAGTALLVAAIAFIAWLVKAGVLVHFISESVMTGFKCGVALFLASTQLPKLFGFHGAHGSFWENAGFFLKHLGETNSISLLVGGVALSLLVVGKLFLPHKPIALFVVIGGIVAASVLSLEAHGVKLIGAVPQGIPPLQLPPVYWRDLNQLLPLAFACFLLSAVETAAIGRMFVAKHGGRFDANQENLALAASNLVAGLGGGFPVGGGTSQSFVNESGGGRTPLSTVFATAFILVVVLFFLTSLERIASAGSRCGRVGRGGEPFQSLDSEATLAERSSRICGGGSSFRRRAHFRPAPRGNDRCCDLPGAVGACRVSGRMSACSVEFLAPVDFQIANGISATS